MEEKNLIVNFRKKIIFEHICNFIIVWISKVIKFLFLKLMRNFDFENLIVNIKKAQKAKHNIWLWKYDL